MPSSGRWQIYSVKRLTERKQRMEAQLYFGGPIWTMASPTPAQALLVQDGIIQKVGDREILSAACPQARPIPLEGRTLVPGFLDAHSHFLACAHAQLQCSVGDAATVEQLLEKIRTYLQGHPVPAGQWVLVRDYDPALLPGGRGPDRWALDRATVDHPVVLQHRSGHVGVLNSLALERMGIHGETTDPPGGHIGKDGREPNGYLEETAFLEVLRRLPSPSLEELLAACDRAQNLYASYGITTAQEGMLVQEMVPLYQALCQGQRLKLDVVGYASWEEAEGIYRTLAAHTGRYLGRFKLGGYKIFLDGSPQSKTAWLRSPYLDGSNGYPILLDSQVREALSQALREGRQLLAHCNGDAAAQQFLDALEAVRCQNPHAPSIRPVMVHAQLVGLDQLPRLANLGVIPSFFPAHIYHWGELHLQNLGIQRASRLSPAASAEALGLPYTFHQDSPVLPPDLPEVLWCAVNRLTRVGRLLGEMERISPLQALQAVTRNTAYQYFEEDAKGTLAPGKRADLVILEQNPLELPPHRLRELRVSETIKDGQVIWRR